MEGWYQAFLFSCLKSHPIKLHFWEVRLSLYRNLLRRPEHCWENSRSFRHTQSHWESILYFKVFDQHVFIWILCQVPLGGQETLVRADIQRIVFIYCLELWCNIWIVLCAIDTLLTPRRHWNGWMEVLWGSNPYLNTLTLWVTGPESGHIHRP